MIEWGTLAVAIIALVQPWLIAWWKRVFRNPEVVAHRTSAVEIGFSSLGPTLGLLGTLEVRHRDTFIRSVDLILTRSKDQAQHRFSWGIFRSFSFGAGAQTSYELCTGFLLRVEEPFRYNIQFWELPHQEEIRQRLQKLREGWQRFFMDSGGRETLEKEEPVPVSGETFQKKAAELYSEFAKEQISVESYSALQRKCYWESGRYTVELQVQSLRPEQSHRRNWSFELSEQDAEQLRSNVVKVLQETCGQFYGQYNFVYADYAGEDA